MHRSIDGKPKCALILAAGKGSRLGIQVKGTHKCLLTIHGKPLIERMIDELKENGIERIFVVVGYESSILMDVLGDRCQFIQNDRYAETNSLYSLWLAKDHIREPFIMLNSDILAHPEVYRKLIHEDGSALTFDGASGDDEEHMKVRFEKGHLRSICKSMCTINNDGESLGILKFDAYGAAKIFKCAEMALKEHGEMTWAPAAVAYLAKNYPIKGIEITGLPWIEIDFPEDLVKAREVVWPSIASQEAKAADERYLKYKTS